MNNNINSISIMISSSSMMVVIIKPIINWTTATLSALRQRFVRHLSVVYRWQLGRSCLAVVGLTLTVADLFCTSPCKQRREARTSACDIARSDGTSGASAYRSCLVTYRRPWKNSIPLNAILYYTMQALVTIQLCVNIHIYIYIYLCVCIYIYIYIYICMNVCMYACMYACVYVCMYAYVYVCIYIYIYIYVYTCILALQSCGRSRSPRPALWLPRVHELVTQGKRVY